MTQIELTNKQVEKIMKANNRAIQKDVLMLTRWLELRNIDLKILGLNKLVKREKLHYISRPNMK